MRVVVVLPTYNNDGTVGDVLARVGRLGLDVCVVDDGSADDTAAILAEWEGAPSETLRQVITHSKNKGKAAALASAFAWGSENGFTHAVTIDTDGQLEPEDIPALLEAARAKPGALILGLRDDRDPAYPAKSRIGRRLSNFFVRLESGASVSDSQCGLRVYPLELVKFVGCRSGRYAFETEILTRAAWAGCDLVHVPVRCRYFSERISHFRPWVDTLRSIAMHAPLVARALVPVRHRRWAGAPAASQQKSFLQSLNPASAMRELRDEPAAASTLALALALGVFIANLPIYGLHAIVALYTSRRLHLNPLAALLGTQVSTPPIGAFLGAAAIAVGHVLLHGAMPVMEELNVSRLGWRNVVGPFLVDWVVGGFLLGFLLGVVTFLMSLPLLRMARQRDAAANPA